MSELAKSSRDAMKAKAKRISDGDPHAKTDCSSWSPPEALNNEAKTGRRPVSRRAFKAGGAVDGEAHKHAGRKARKTGGIVASYAADDTKEANKSPHVGGYKRGGHVDEAADKKLIKREVKSACMKRPGKDLGGIIGGLGGGALPVLAAKLLGGKKKDNVNAIDAKKSGGRAKRAIGGKLNPKTKDKAYGLGQDAYLNGEHKNPFSAHKTPASRVDKMDDLAWEHSKGYDAAEKDARQEAKYRRGRKDGGKADGVYQGTRPTGGREARAEGGKVYTHELYAGRDTGKHKAGQLIGQYQSGSRARLARDKHDNEYGAYAYRVRPVQQSAPSEPKAEAREARASGGRTKKGTNINIIISAGQKPQQPMPMPAAAPPPMPPMPPAGGPPPGAPMPPGAGGPMPMMRNRGGRAPARKGPYFSLEAGSGGGLGRLQKARGKKP